MDLHNCDLILGLDWLTYFRAHIFCDRRRVELTAPLGERIIYLNERSEVTPFSRRYYSSLYCLLANLAISDEPSEANYPSVVSEFPDVFPEDISGLPPIRKIDF